MNKKKKILHLITGLNVGGTELFLSRLLPALTDFDHIVVSLTNKGEVGEILEKRGIKVYELKAGKWLSPFSAWRFYKIIKKENSDILSTWLLHADIFGRLFGKLFGVKRIISNIRVALPIKKYWIYIILSKITANLVDQWTANSKTVVEFCIDKLGASKEKTVLIYNGIDMERFSIEIDKVAKRAELGIGIDDFVVITVARLSPQKGINCLIEAADLIGNKKSDNGRKITFLIVGDGSERGALEKMASGLGNIRFLGGRNDILELLKMSDVFVLPTLFEGLSNAILEAMAVGLPVITTDIKENREIITDQENGLLIPISDIGKIKDLILIASNNKELQLKIKENSKKIIENKFNFNASIEKFREIFDGTLSE